jgi:hypothetical protein
VTTYEERVSAPTGQPEPDVVVDRVGLGYRVRGGQLHVSYPLRLSGGQVTYGSGFPLGPLPSLYWTGPPNAITAERVALWTTLVGCQRTAAPSGDAGATRRRGAVLAEEDVDIASDLSFPASDPPAWMGSTACIAPGAGEHHPVLPGSPNASGGDRAS